MNDKEKFLVEWETRFPNEEVPDAAFMASVNFMNIRSRILESESKIKDLRRALEKEEFILNWLISLDIEISVSGNVGIVSENTSTDGPNPTPVWLEGERSYNNTDLHKDESNITDVKKQSEDLQEEQESLENNDSLDGSAKSVENETVLFPQHDQVNGRTDIVNDEPPTEPLGDNTAPGIRPIDLSLKIKAESVDTPDEHEYENVFELFGNPVSDLETPESPPLKGKDKRRAGGSWSIYIKEKNNANEEKEKTETNHDTVPNHNEAKMGPKPRKHQIASRTERVNVYEEIDFPVKTDGEDLTKNDNVVINQLYEPVEFKKEIINTEIEEEEDGGEAVYVNIRDLDISHILTPMARVEGSDTSDYDSDNGKSDEKSQCYRPMTEDEINNLKKWGSDEDLSQSNQDFGKIYFQYNFKYK